MNEVVASFSRYFSTRAKTQVYGIFGFWWLVFHWEFFYTAFFVDQGLIFKKTHFLKNEYLKQRFYNYQSWHFWVIQAIYLLLSAGLTVLMIWVIPRFILLSAYEQEQKDRNERLKIKLKYESHINAARTDLERVKVELEKETVTRLKATEKKLEKEKEVHESILEQWKEDYAILKKSSLYGQFDQLILSLYKHGGEIEVTDDYREQVLFALNKDLLAYADTNDLITYDRNKGIISLTDKGKYFVKTFQSERL